MAPTQTPHCACPDAFPPAIVHQLPFAAPIGFANLPHEACYDENVTLHECSVNMIRKLTMKQVAIFIVLVVSASSSQSSVIDDKILSLQRQIVKLQAEKAALNQSSVGSTGAVSNDIGGVPSTPSSVAQALAGAGGYPAIVFENGRDAIHAP